MTAQVLYDALCLLYAAPDYAVLPQATQGTGHHASRWLDALVISLWPSRGLWLHGFEIKISRGDWVRELKQPEKGDALVDHLDYFSVVAPTSIVPQDTLPPTWGLFEFADGALSAAVKPKPLHEGGYTRPLPRSFFAGLCRRLDQSAVAGKVSADRRAEYERGRKQGAADAKRGLSASEHERIAAHAFAEAAGWLLSTEAEARRVGLIAKSLCELGKPGDKWSGTQNQLKSARQELDKAIKLLGVLTSPRAPDAVEDIAPFGAEE